MSPIILSILAALSVMLISLSGVICTVHVFGAWMNRNLTYLATFSAGVLTILAYHLVIESVHESESVAIVAGSIIAGAIILEIIHHALPHQEHHHHEMPADHAHSEIDGRRVLFSDAIHNITDGFIIVPAFFIDWTIGLAATVGILLHELVQEISEFFVLKEAGYTTKKTLTLNFIASSTILVGVVLALVLASFDGLLAILAGLAAGGFLSLVVRDLLPNAFVSIRAHGYLFVHIVAALLGAVLMFGVITLMPHEEHDGEQEETATVTQALEHV
ncbi:hypothetical protein A2673_02615 [Candidatus Kaiserbacteria bacterium RIFCSPHIGHO2_01_FULL_50_13]|uniref:ZIP family metal transporter n=1 Tax=Candidatus Kaiserbacteria bacterium RIFCSPLOWO2_01_FULL_50_24 TaxID=1798507 RepID=A0A1F6ER65_9BACT|nr:MAG: hypothetical protein A2673_02615 [Candidatus Kaiserbacteria bacterium RIFCSPHIGHO2_01_FULL_50_13]OGG76128.1 MAG: hypothetical protein A3A34_00895 [Candidatus Kaiserbacteria bacterium RIFCSPLOWO2_01_FULL_50_24]